MVLAGNFDDALNEAGQQAEVQHLLQCYALESDLLDVAARGETVTDSHLARYGSSLEDYVGGKLVALYRGDAAAQGGTSSAAAETETEAQAASDAERQPAALRTVYTSFPWDEALRARRILTACTGTAAGRICCSRRRWKPWAIRPSRC